MIVEVNKHTTLYYYSPLESNTQPAKETLLFVHGMESCKETWKPIIDSLKSQYHIYALDLRGHGMSPMGDVKELTLELLAEDIHDFVREKKLDRFVLVGHSMGSRVAIAYAHHHPEKVQALVLEDMDLLPREARVLTSKELKSFQEFRQEHESEKEAREELIKYGYEQKKIDSWVAQGKIKVTVNNTHIGLHPYVTYLTHNACQANGKAAELFKKVGEEKIPILLLRAEEDSSTSEPGVSQMKEMAPEMKVVTIPGSTHAIHKTQPLKFQTELTKFLNQR